MSNLDFRDEILRLLLEYPNVPLKDIKRRESFNVKSFSDLDKIILYLKNVICINNPYTYGGASIVIKMSTKNLFELKNDTTEDLGYISLESLLFIMELRKFYVPVAKGDMNKLMRYVKISEEEYLENIDKLSIYYNILKKNNPNLKSSDSVKLLHEVSDIKTSSYKAVSHDTRISNKRGKYALYGKSYSTDDIISNYSSFNWFKLDLTDELFEKAKNLKYPDYIGIIVNSTQHDKSDKIFNFLLPLFRKDIDDAFNIIKPDDPGSISGIINFIYSYKYKSYLYSFTFLKLLRYLINSENIEMTKDNFMKFLSILMKYKYQNEITVSSKNEVGNGIWMAGDVKKISMTSAYNYIKDSVLTDKCNLVEISKQICLTIEDLEKYGLNVLDIYQTILASIYLYIKTGKRVEVKCL